MKARLNDAKSNLITSVKPEGEESKDLYDDIAQDELL
jgi:hypothetical protein